jgi:Tol biopolymer transport system component
MGFGLAVLLLSAGPASAQYFGRNKVQYEAFDFQVLRTEHFDIHYYLAEQDAALHAAAMAERWYGRLSRALDHQLSGRTPIVLYASQTDFRQTTVLPGLVPDGVGGFTDHQKGRVVLPFAASLGETDRILGHELVHAFQRDVLDSTGRSMAGLPLWFLEGMAEHLTIGRLDANTAMWVRDAVHGKRLPAIRQLHEPRWFPYRYGHALWAFLAQTYGDDIAARALASKAAGSAIGRLRAVTGERESKLTERWHQAMRAWSSGRRPDLCRPDVSGPALLPADCGISSTVLIADNRGGGRLNVGPALSPDGSQIVFLSERDRYSVDLFLADARTGAVRRKIVSTAGNARFDSLQFIDSAGAWDTRGARFAFAALRHGQPVLTALRMPSGDVEWTHVFSELEQIFDPTWSPDGRQLAFAAMRGGATDLYVFDIDAGSLRRLTRDAFADLQPAWSPDGRTLAFTTDRFTSSLDSLLFGDYRLAAVDLMSGEIRELPSIDEAKNIDPQWIGGTLVFIADAGGVSNVFRLDPAAGTVHQITNERTGVSGVTALSPALSVAPGARQLAYTVYANGGFHIRTMPLGGGTAMAGPLARPEPRRGPTSPPLASAAPSFPTGKYRGRLTLNSIGQPYLSAGGGALGGFFRAGMSLSFSDLLEQQQLQTAVQVGTRAQDFAVQTAYINRRSRWSWGLLGAQLPVGLASTRTRGDDGGVVRETEWYRQTHRQAMLLGTYPFSRVQRLELTSGLHAVGFGREVRTQNYDRLTGRLVSEERQRLDAPRPVLLFESAAALVYDSSVAGPTAPVLGRRSRFEVSPTLGDLAFVTVTADFRQYLMPVPPLTIAWRLHHVGRYGPDAGDARLLPLVWTLRDLVRGYSMRHAVGAACAKSCDWLIEGGVSRMFAANLELRAPLIGPLGLLRQSGFAPIDAFAFADAGLFGHPARGSSSTLRAVGGGVRVNATGFVFEFAAARPFDRERSGWTLAVNFRPGF